MDRNQLGSKKGKDSIKVADPDSNKVLMENSQGHPKTN